MRPQWLVRPPTMRERNQRNFEPGAETYGSPFDFPSTIGGEEFIFESLARPASHTRAAMRQVVRPNVFFVISFRNHGRPGLEQCDTQTAPR